jgi:probable HAF family extracellular repeat protein
MRLSAVAACLFFSLSICQASFAVSWQTVDFPGARDTVVNGINTSGQMVGQYDATGTHGFLLSAGVFTTIDYPGAVDTYCEGINDNGDIVGIYVAAGGSNHGFLMQGQTFTSLDFPGASRYTQAFGINNAVQVVGEYTTGFEIHGFLYQNGTYADVKFHGAQLTQLRGINNAGDMVGAIASKKFNSGQYFGVLLSGTDRVLDFPGSTATFANGINDLGYIVGYHGLSAGIAGFVYYQGHFTSLSHPNWNYMHAQGINNSLSIVGTYTDTNGIEHGFLRTP